VRFYGRLLSGHEIDGLSVQEAADDKAKQHAYRQTRLEQVVFSLLLVHIKSS